MPLPPDRHGVGRDRAAAQAQRLRDAVVDQVASRGYERTTVAHVVGAARVSYEAFYSRFENLDECYRDAMELFTERVQAASTPTRRDGELPLDGLERSLRGYLATLAASPVQARCLVLGPPQPGGADDAEREIEALMTAMSTRDRFACIAYRAIVHELVDDEVRVGRAAQLEALADPVMRLVRHHLRAA